jgi:hypothetical protein
MKRSPAAQKLVIRRNTIRQLGRLELAHAVGGELALAPDSGAVTCAPASASPVRPLSSACG